MAGLTAQGLEIKRLPEILEAMIEAERRNIDPEVATEDSSIIGQLNNIYAAPAAELWALSQAVDDNFKPLKAEGTNLDDLVVINGISRDVAIASFTDTQRYYGENNTVIPPTVILENPITLDRFSPVASITLNASSCTSCRVGINTVGVGLSYTVSVNSATYTSTAVTALAALNEIASAINSDSSATYSAVIDTTAQDLLIESDDSNDISFTSNTLFDILEVSNYGLTRAQEVGSIVAPLRSVNTIVVGTSGLNSTVNEQDYTEGRPQEDDETLRARFLATKQITASATAQAIEDIVLSVPGVSSALVIENDTEFTDVDGRPPRSFETISQGGVDLEVANAIWSKKPAGIKTFGNTAELVLDRNGATQEVNFTRPSSVFLAVRVTYNLYSEEVLSPAAEAVMSPVIVDFINNLTINNDVIPRRILGPVYAAVDGIDFLNIEVQTLVGSGDTPVIADWSDSRLPVSATEFARTTSVDIYFNPV